MDRRLVVCVAGLKGAAFLDGLIGRQIRPSHVVAYSQSDDRSDGFERVRTQATAAGATFESARRPRLGANDLVFVVGWQYLLPAGLDAQIVVFHDSLLPKYRGFAPTVTALIKGEPKIGVTAFSPTDVVDAGPILAQAAFDVRYPMKVADALALQARLMCELAAEIIHRDKHGRLEGVPQKDGDATYSLWRDSLDYVIDWTRPADEIARMIDATGYPYAGARTKWADTEILVDQSTPVGELNFAIRMPGKVWRMDASGPVVVCGTGLLRLEACRTVEGEPFVLRDLRERLG